MTGTRVEDMTTVTLVTTAERMCGAIEKWLDMTPERRATPKSEGLCSPNSFVSMLTIPLVVIFLREIHRRGIDSGWGWLIEDYDKIQEECKTKPVENV